MRKKLARIVVFGLAIAVMAGAVADAAWPRAAHSPAALRVVAQAEAKAETPPRGTKALDGLDEFIAGVMKDWKIPGLSMAVVQNGQVVFLKGYGYRDFEKQTPVTPHTLFAIGSITKSFTVTAMGMLADEGKLDWDKPVRDFLPEFQLVDPVASERITPRDLATHRTGVPRHDLVWYSSDFSRADLVRRLRHLEPSQDIRTTYQYNNMMFMTAGYMVGRLAGTTWEDFIRQRIFTPLSMRDTVFSVNDSQKSADFAMPYQNAKGDVKLIPFHIIDSIGPAGSINSSADDMSRYVAFQLGKGAYDGKQLLSENNANQMQSPQMIEPSADRYREILLPTYGLGLGVTTYRGHKLVSHGGAIDGFTAQLALLPMDNLGVIVLANLNSDKNPVPVIVAYSVFDRLLGLEPVPWNARFLDEQKKSDASEEEAKKQGFSFRKPGTHPSHDLADYVGEYENPGYGVIRIERAGENLKLSLNQLTSPLQHFHYDVFETLENPVDPMEKTKVQFFMDVKGEISSLSMPLEPHVKDIVFNRRPEKAMTERSFLEMLVGRYQVGAITETVAIEGDKTLVLLVPGQPKYTLVPVRGTTYDIKELAGFSVEFKRDASGKVTGAVFYEPGATFAAQKN
jgi:CubicO group peptidase (beta-lactamase class C family)